MHEIISLVDLQTDVIDIKLTPVVDLVLCLQSDLCPYYNCIPVYLHIGCWTKFYFDFEILSDH